MSQARSPKRETSHSRHIVSTIHSLKYPNAKMESILFSIILLILSSKQKLILRSKALDNLLMSNDLLFMPMVNQDKMWKILESDITHKEVVKVNQSTSKLFLWEVTYLTIKRNYQNSKILYISIFGIVSWMLIWKMYKKD